MLCGFNSRKNNDAECAKAHEGKIVPERRRYPPPRPRYNTAQAECHEDEECEYKTIEKEISHRLVFNRLIIVDFMATPGNTGSGCLETQLSCSDLPQ